MPAGIEDYLFKQVVFDGLDQQLITAGFPLVLEEKDDQETHQVLVPPFEAEVAAQKVLVNTIK